MWETLENTWVSTALTQVSKSSLPETCLQFLHSLVDSPNPLTLFTDEWGLGGGTYTEPSSSPVFILLWAFKRGQSLNTSTFNLWRGDLSIHKVPIITHGQLMTLHLTQIESPLLFPTLYLGPNYAGSWWQNVVLYCLFCWKHAEGLVKWAKWGCHWRAFTHCPCYVSSSSCTTHVLYWAKPSKCSSSFREQDALGSHIICAASDKAAQKGIQADATAQSTPVLQQRRSHSTGAETKDLLTRQTSPCECQILPL